MSKEKDAQVARLARESTRLASNLAEVERQLQEAQDEVRCDVYRRAAVVAGPVVVVGVEVAVVEVVEVVVVEVVVAQLVVV